MTINEHIRTALKATGLPVVPDHITHEFSRYFVFNYTSIPDDFGDDAPQHERYLIQIHLFCPNETDTMALRKQTKQLLFGYGFTFPIVVDASDSDGQHWVFEVEMAVAPDG